MAALPPARALPVAAQYRIVGLVGIGIVAVAMLAWLISGLFAAAPAAPEKLPPGAFRPTAEQLRQLTISPVRYGADADLLQASGSIAADADHSTPILLPFAGQVTDVMVVAGQGVAKGQPLFRIASPDVVDARNALTTATAQARTAAQALTLAQQNAARQKAIYETAGGAFKDYAQAQNDLVAAQSAVRSAQSAVQAARGRLAIFGPGAGTSGGGTPTTVFRAPVGGLIADRSVAPGQFIAAGNGTPLMTITDPSRVWLVAQLAESEAADARVGDQVTVTTPALPGRRFTARIDYVGAALDPATHRLPVRATIDNPDGALKPQMFASFDIRRRLTTGGNSLLVPAQAVIHEGDTARVWVLAPDGLLYARAVQVGDTEGGMTHVTAGLRSGDRVVTSGALFVNEAGLEQ
ncbi:efflux RND transporter periplasmic adaptor subunit [Sphingomonas sp.]|uniref:efflux RND transporter periplasmic adaptor subunit n=1 Tax=Sphingomonas sp. TaxID=28214 RepID=UPI0025DDFD5E|nr:efflux RND transporter periplasmic adaptor subunit [Sphingomonas sp.]